MALQRGTRRARVRRRCETAQMTSPCDPTHPIRRARLSSRSNADQGAVERKSRCRRLARERRSRSNFSGGRFGVSRAPFGRRSTRGCRQSPSAPAGKGHSSDAHRGSSSLLRFLRIRPNDPKDQHPDGTGEPPSDVRRGRLPRKGACSTSIRRPGLLCGGSRISGERHSDEITLSGVLFKGLTKRRSIL